MNEAPKTIFLYSKYPGEYYPHYLETRRKSSDIEYIRKAEFDEAQARIKELEEALEKTKSFCLRGRSVVSAFEIARNALAKESEG